MQLFKIKADSCIKKENEYSTYLRGTSRFPFSFFFLKLSNLDGKDTKKNLVLVQIGEYYEENKKCMYVF